MRAVIAEDSRAVVTERAEPEPRPGEVLIEVAAAGVNRADLLQVAGRYPPPPGASDVLGLECSGRVVAAGSDTDSGLIGREVWALVDGGACAEFVCAPATQVSPLDEGTDAVAVAALPEALATAWYNLAALARLTPGETVLIHGGSGGVGHVAIQVARLLGARVLATVGSPEKAQRCRLLGADHSIDYHDDVPASVARLTGGRGVDVILDVLGADALGDNLRVLGTGGRLAVIGLQQGTRGEIDLGRVLARHLTILGSTLRARGAAEKAEIVAGARFFAPRVAPVIHAALPLGEVAEAHALLDDEDTFGKVVLIP